jgi:S-(hydroxymethyl)glutathione dehydrogenase / alcohol dehydrogenase
VKAAVCRAFGSALGIEEVAVRPPGPGEVSVRVAACAICHSDIAFIDGAWGGPLPAVYGHEAAGVVTETGPGVAGLAGGDHVVVTLIRSCGRCARCLRGQPALCEGLPVADASPVLAGAGGEAIHQGMRTGAFAGLVTVDRSQVVAVPPSVPLDVACLLACGVLTGVGAVMNTAAVEPGSTVVVLGAGGVGLNCVQGSVLAGAGQVIAVDLVPAKREAARLFGATHVIDPARDTVAAVRELTGGRGVDHVLVAAGIGSLIETGVTLLRGGGSLVIVGLPPAGATISLDPLAIADGSLRVLGSKMGASDPARDIPKLVELYRAGRLKLDELVSQRFELGRINDAIESARAGAQLRPVIVFPALPRRFRAGSGGATVMHLAGEGRLHLDAPCSGTGQSSGPRPRPAREPWPGALAAQPGTSGQTS